MTFTPVTIPTCQWTLVQSDFRQGRIEIISENPSKYYYIAVPTGDAAPTETPIEGILFIGSDLDLNYREHIDFYMAAFDSPGKVIFNTDAPYVDTYLQDQTTPALITNFNQVQASTTLTAAGVKFAYTITVASTTGMILPTGIFDGSYLILFDVGSGRFWLGHVVSILGLVVTLDTQLDFDFPIGTIVDVTITNMAVDGSVTPQIYGIRGLGVIPGIDKKYDITRIIFTCLCDTSVSLATFGDLPKLLRGIALRYRNSVTNNIFNAKTNEELEGITLDWKPYSKLKPNEGQDGFSARLTFGGQDKIGVVERIGPGEDLEFLVQDNLTGLIKLDIVAEGHEVD